METEKARSKAGFSFSEQFNATYFGIKTESIT